MTVSLLAIQFDILPVLVAAILSGLILNFFFLKPLYTFHISSSKEVLLFFMYIVIALINAMLTFKIRKAESASRDKEEKENTIKLYNTLLNSLSHELRTPIATIIGAVDTLRISDAVVAAHHREALLEEIDKASYRLNRQVENLLNMSRLETGMLQPKLDWCDFNELIYGVIQKYFSDIEHHAVVYNANDRLPLFMLDAGLMEEVLLNLIQNALLYTPNSSTITITAKDTDYGIELAVIDNGKGFSTTETQLIFDKFYRGSNTKTGGSGLGLSIVKGFIEAHKGTILATTNTDGGATFLMQIPAQTTFINHLNNE